MTAQRGVERVLPGVLVVDTPVALDGSLGSLEFVSLLRRSIESSQRVSWRCESTITVERAGMLEHLPPPSEGGGEGGDAWRANHRYGSYYYRLGPGFVSVRDRRMSYPASFLDLSVQALDCFGELSEPTQHSCGRCRPLTEEGVIWRSGGTGVLLPFRLKYPPTPFLAV